MLATRQASEPQTVSTLRTLMSLPAYGVTYACAALFRSDSGTRGRLRLPLCILVLGSVIVDTGQESLCSRGVKD
jgi:hypothetical protein